MVLVKNMREQSNLTTELSWIILVLLPRVNVYTLGIGLLDDLWNLLEPIIDTRIKMEVMFHDVLHRFCACRDTGIYIMDINMDQ